MHFEFLDLEFPDYVMENRIAIAWVLIAFLIAVGVYAFRRWRKLTERTRPQKLPKIRHRK